MNNGVVTSGKAQSKKVLLLKKQEFTPVCGFTLIELSIVLVILGLIVGGVLVGQDLIKTAQVRMTIAQIESFETAATTFKLKFQCVPGDCPNPSDFGLSGGCNAAIADVCGNGTVGGKLEAGYAGSEYALRESLDFWLQLSQASLISGNYIGYDASAIDTAYVGEAFPSIKLNGKLGILPRAHGSLRGAPNAFWIYTSVWIAGGISGQPKDLLLPMDNYRIDSKLDDGFPDTGKVILAAPGVGYSYLNHMTAREDLSLYAYGPPGATSNFCATNQTPAMYNVLNVTSFWDYPGHDVTPNCSIMIRTNF
jgi:prepilin-type N-terminal cleavage/methylation domain-containing protein